MSEMDVNEIMGNANEKYTHMISVDHPRDGYSNTYIYTYEPKYSMMLTKKEQPLYVEYNQVYFDPNGYATKMNYSLYTKDICQHEILRIDLKKKSMEEDW